VFIDTLSSALARRSSALGTSAATIPVAAGVKKAVAAPATDCSGRGGLAAEPDHVGRDHHRAPVVPIARGSAEQGEEDHREPAGQQDQAQRREGVGDRQHRERKSERHEPVAEHGQGLGQEVAAERRTPQ
jgi:hypothetical protein